MSKVKFLGPTLDFASAEAYKLLRTNIIFSLPEEKDCYIIGVTSSERSEGKSVTSINLAYTFAEQGKKTLLIEADMRLPGVSEKLGVERKPGLSNVLVSKTKKTEATLRLSGLHKDFHVLACGDVPPNPSELLSSKKMTVLLDSLSSQYDYIILDLPPVNIVSDAMVISPYLDGMLFVVREDYTSKRAVNDAIKALQFADVKILGFVTTFAESANSKYHYRKYKYGKKYKYGYKYSKGYNYNYDYGYAKKPKEEKTK